MCCNVKFIAQIKKSLLPLYRFFPNVIFCPFLLIMCQLFLSFSAAALSSFASSNKSACTSSLAQRETKRTPCPLTQCSPSERTLEIMTPLQTSQEITALLPTDIIPHIPSSPQTLPPPSRRQKHE